MQIITDKLLYIKGVEGVLYHVTPLERTQIEAWAKVKEVSIARAADLIYAATSNILGAATSASISAIRNSGLDSNGV